MVPRHVRCKIAGPGIKFGEIYFFLDGGIFRWANIWAHKNAWFDIDKK